MGDEEKEVATEVEATTELAEPKPIYHLHIELADEMKQRLKDCAELAYKMGDIPKPDLVNMMNLFIGWGMEIQKKKWLDRVGYK